MAHVKSAKAQREDALARMRIFTGAAEQEKKASAARKAAQELLDREGPKLQRELARARAKHASPTELRAIALKAAPGLAGKLSSSVPADWKPAKPAANTGQRRRPELHFDAPHVGAMHGALDPSMRDFYAGLLGQRVFIEAPDSSLLSPEELLAGVIPPRPKLAGLESDLGLGLPMLSSLAPPTAADLLPTPETALTPDLTALASSLGGKALALYNYVHTRIGPELYYGSRKGAAETLAEGVGNDFDQSALLVALLRASNIPARYEYGTVQLSGAQAIALTGAADVTHAAAMLSATSPATLSPDGQSVQQERVWVRAYVPYGDYRGTGPGGDSLWVRLDPALKRISYSQAVNLKGLVTFDTAAFLAAPTPKTPREVFEAQLLQAAQAKSLCNTLDDALQKAIVANDAFTLLPADLPAPLVQSLAVFDAPPTQYQYQVQISLDDQTEFFPLVQLQAHSVSLRYFGSTPGDVAAIAAAGGLQNVVPYNVNVTPTLQVDGQTVATFQALNPGTAQTLTVQVTVPGGSPALMVHNITAGTQYAVMVNGGVAPASRVATLQKALDGLTGDELQVAQSQLALALWSQQQEGGSARMFGLQSHASIKDVSEGIAGRQLHSQLLFGLPTALSLGGYALDIGRDSLTPLPRDGDASFVPALVTLSGYNGSTLEAKSWEQVLTAPAVSTTRILQNANAQSIPVYMLSPGNTGNRANLTGYSQDSLTEVDDSLSAGWTVTIPQHPVSFLTYSGEEAYILLNPVDGSGVYRINEALNGGADDDDGATDGPPEVCTQCSSNSTGTGSAVNLANGNLREQMTDLTLPAVGLPISWSRTYASRTPQLTDMGFGWISSYGMFLQANLDGSFTYVTDDWRQVLFTPVSGGFQSAAGWHMTLTALAGGQYALRTKNGVVSTFNAQGQLLSIAEPAGNTTTLVYQAGLLAEVLDSSGAVALTLTHTGNKLTQVADRAGRSVSFGYTADDLTSAIDALGHVETYAYDNSHRLIQRTDRRGKVWTEAYDFGGRWVGGADPTGGAWTASYDLVNQRTLLVDRTGAAWSHEFNAIGNPTATTDPLGNREETVWDSDFNPLTKKDARGFLTAMTYDTQGNQLTRTSPDNRVTTTTYDPTFNQPTQVFSTGLPPVFSNYDPVTSRLLSRTDGLGTTNYVYDGKGQLQTMTAPGSAVTSFTYDGHGSAQTVTDATNGTTVLGYDGAGHLTSLTDANHNTRTRLPDALGRVLTLTDALHNSTSFNYDEVGHRTSTIDAARGVTAFAYDDAGRMTSTTDAQQHVTRVEYDAEGRATARVDANNNRTVTAYDTAGRLSSTTGADGSTTTQGFCAGLSTQPCAAVDALGNLTTTQFDSVGRPLTVDDPLNRVTQQSYEASGRLGEMSGPNQPDTHYGYGGNGLLSNVSNAVLNVFYQYDGRGNRTQVQASNETIDYTYDLANRLATETNSLHQTTTYTYDPAGNRATKLDGNNQLTTYGFDADRRLKSVTFADNSQYLFDYDERGNRTLEQSPSHKRNLSYDSLNRLAVVVDATLGRTLTYGYDSNGNRTSLVISLTPSGQVEQQYIYAYDVNNRLAEVTDAQGNSTFFTYDADGRRATVVRPNSVTTGYAYDAAGQVLSIVHANAVTGATLASFTYGYDFQGNRINRTREDGSVEVYKYDSLQRLAEADYGSSRAVKYAVDSLGNRQLLSETDSTGDGSVSTSSVSSTYNAFNQLSAASASSFTTSSNTAYLYDGNGNTLSQTTTPPSGASQLTSYTWDLDNRLREVQLPSGLTDFFAYDANGLRIQRLDSAGTTNYLLDGPSVLEETDSNGRLFTSYVCNPQRSDDIVSVARTGATYYPLSDALGSIYAVADSAGTVTDTWAYDAYGSRRHTSGGLSFNFGFTGREHDSDSGLVYHRDRYRDPNTDGWLSADRLGLLSGANYYLYVNGSPVARVDATGQLAGPGPLALPVATEVAAVPVYDSWTATAIYHPLFFLALLAALGEVSDDVVTKAQQKCEDDESDSVEIFFRGDSLSRAQDSVDRGFITAGIGTESLALGAGLYMSRDPAVAQAFASEAVTLYGSGAILEITISSLIWRLVLAMGAVDNAPIFFNSVQSFVPSGPALELFDASSSKAIIATGFQAQ